MQYCILAISVKNSVKKNGPGQGGAVHFKCAKLTPGWYGCYWDWFTRTA
jgi:hypothetical protein